MVRYITSFICVWLFVYLSWETWRVATKQQKKSYFRQAMKALSVTIVSALLVCGIVALF